MILIIETPHRGPIRNWSTRTIEQAAAIVRECNPDAEDLDDLPPRQAVEWLLNDLRSLEIREAGYSISEIQTAIDDMSDDDIDDFCNIGEDLAAGETVQAFIYLMGDSIICTLTESHDNILIARVELDQRRQIDSIDSYY